MELNSQPKHQYHKKCILFIDDNSEMFFSLETIFNHFGYGVVFIDKGLEAIRLLESDPNKFHLIISDLNMPDINGFELAQKILGIIPNMPIIICTGNDCLGSEEMIEYGLSNILIKPFSMQDLKNVIDKVLEDNNSTTIASE